MDLEKIFRLKAAQKSGLAKLGLVTAADLLRYLPHRYERPRPSKLISELQAGDEVSVYGLVVKSEMGKTHRRRLPIAEVTIEDQSGRLKAVWYRQAYLAKMAPVGSAVRLSGRVATRANSTELYLANPELARADEAALAEGGLFTGGENEPLTTLTPIYPETRELSSAWLTHAIGKLLTSGLAENLPDPLPTPMRERYHLPALATALIWVHRPRSENDAETARKRFAFEEVLLIQLARLKLRQVYRAQKSFSFTPDKQLVGNFTNRLPYQLTRAQTAAIEEILGDFGKNQPMLRLLEGDVGSGKTVVAAAAALAAASGGPGWSVAYMAPTEILARQHFASFTELFAHLPMNIGLLTGNECRKFPSKIHPRESTKISRSQLLKWVGNGEIPILVGTHTLIQKSVKFKNLALVIIDEQHRFGVEQRARLGQKSERAPHLLSMTATPIPRTLALTIYGDLDLTLLDELPPGRKWPITTIVPEAERALAYEQIRAELRLGRQVFVICPRINEPDPAKELALQVKSAKAEAKILQTKIFPEFTVGLVHGKQKPAEKEEAMTNFAAGKIQILVATSVVEVGVNVPNATIIVIEGAERFGLAQLHQLRGRVMRSAHQPHCFLFTSRQAATGLARLKALQEAKSGFALAELDLKLRGAGALSGGKQWGLSDVGMEAIQNLKMVAAARNEAEQLLAADPELTNHPLLHERLAVGSAKIHFE